MRFKNLDLNLLVAFDALMETRGVSRAAAQMNLSQPAMSAALARLRDYFNDPLLLTEGKRMVPTAFAETLVPLVRDSLRKVEEVIAASAIFDPATSQRVFRLIASDYIVAAVIAPLVQRLVGIAPGVRIETLLPDQRSIDLITKGQADLLITPDDFLSRESPTELLFEERYVVAGWAGNPLFDRGMTEADFMAAGHVVVVIGAERTLTFAERQIEKMGRIRRIEVAASSFTSVPWFLVDTMRLALMHERLARRMRTLFPLALAPIPFPFPAMRQMMQFSQMRASDEGLRWLREQIRSLEAGE